MMLNEQVFANALLLAGEVTEQQSRILEVLCNASTSSLKTRLRDGLTPDDCKADFIASASLFSLAALNGIDGSVDVSEFKAGDLTVKRTGADAASR